MEWFKKHKILTVVLVLVGLVAIGGAMGGGNQTQQPANQAAETAPPEPANQPQLAKIGEPARDGRFEFVVRSIECGHASVGSDFMTRTAQGQFCFLTVNVKNIGNERQSLLADNQKLLDAGNREFSADSLATLYAGPQGTTATWLNDINPGNSVEGIIVFDVPKDVTPVVARLHDSAFSGGVRVNLQ